MQSPNKDQVGDLSWLPLKEQSIKCIHLVYWWCIGTIPIIGVGGVNMAHNAYKKLKGGHPLSIFIVPWSTKDPIWYHGYDRI